MLSLRLHAKFLVLVLGVLAAFLGALFFILDGREARLLSRKTVEEQHALAQGIVRNLEESMREGKPDMTISLLEGFSGVQEIVRIEVLRRDGSRAFSRDSIRYDLPQIEEAFSSGSEVRVQEGGDPPINTILFPLKNGDECIGCHRNEPPVLGVILISHSMEDAVREIGSNRRDLAALFLVIIAVIGGVLYAALRTVVLKPMDAIRRGAESVGAGYLSHRINVETGDEFQDVAQAFNRMAAALTRMYADLETLVQARTKELDESFRLLGGIVTSMPGGVMLLDMDGRVKMINRYAVQMMRCREEEVVGRKLSDALPSSAALVAAVFEKADGGLFQELEYIAPDGTQVPIGFSSTYYRGAAGGYEGIIVSFRDLSELKALQAELVSKERFAAMGRLVAGVAHEVRNPLFGISSIGQIFERELTNPAHIELVQALLSEARRLNQLVDELLLYGRPVQLKPFACDLRKLWQEVLDANRQEIQEMNVRTAVDDAGSIPRVLADPHQMRQVFLNLLRNALEASPRGSTISARFLIADRYLVFELRDEGEGIPGENQDKVFDLFFTTKHRGTGLGLAICRKIVEDHGGDIKIESDAGAGSRVTVRLPYRRVSDILRQEDAGEAGPGPDSLVR